MCTFRLRVRGTRQQHDEVAHYLGSRVRTNDGKHLITVDDHWAELWAQDPESAWQRSDGELLIEGESRDVPGLHLAKHLSETFPDLTIHIGGCDEEGNCELWELIGGEGRLLDLDGSLTFWELGFGVGYWLVRDGQEVSAEQRQAWLAEEVARHEAMHKEGCGAEYSAEQMEQRQVVIRRELELLEERLRRDATRNAALLESADVRRADLAEDSRGVVPDEAFLQALAEMERGERHNERLRMHDFRKEGF